MKNNKIIKLSCLFFVIAINLLFSDKAFAAILNVPSTSYPTIQSAVNAANAGDTIILQAGTTFTESVVLKYKTGSDYITIQSSALSSLPNDNTRVKPSDSQFMPKIVPVSPGDPAFLTEITTNGPSHHYKLLGLEVTLRNGNQFSDTLIRLGDGTTAQNTLAKVAHHLTIDRCYIHGYLNEQVKRGVSLNSSDSAVLNSYISEIHQIGFDNQAIAGWNGSGNYQIINNYLEAGSENVIFGGSDPSIPNLIPTNIEIRRNLFTKNIAWFSRPVGSRWNIKNIFELKSAKQVTIQENIFENNWTDGQSGWSILFTVRNQDGSAPWSTIEDVDFSNNIVRNTPFGINTLIQDDNNPSQNAKRINIHHNLILAISGLETSSLFGKCFQFVGGGTQLLDTFTINHNTCVGLATGTEGYPYFITGAGAIVSGLNIRNNVSMSKNTFTTDIVANSSSGGIASLNALAGNTWSFQKNVLMVNGTNYPNTTPNSPNYYFSDPNPVGFVDFANGNYALSSSSPYHNQGTDGTDIGANVTQLDTQKPCIISGNWSSCGSTVIQTTYSHRTNTNILTPIEVEDFDNGGQTIAYNDTFGTTSSGAYRTNPTETVDLSANANASNGYVAFEAGAGEWMEYTVNVPTSGSYKFSVRYSSEFNNGKFHLEVCEPSGTGVTNCISSTQLTVNSTTSWSVFKNLTTSMNLTAGTRILRLVMDVNSPDSCGCVVANFDSITINRPLFDYDADGKADIAIFRPSNGQWWYLLSGTGTNGATTFGTSTDKIVPADFTGDGKTDRAFFRPSTNEWFILRSEDSSFYAFPFGSTGDIPAPSDYDGDGKSDAAVFRPSTATWYINKSSGGTTIVSFGSNGDIPTPADYDGDGKSDVSVFRPSNGTWYRLNSSNGQFVAIQLGQNGDIPVPADYNGDGKADTAVYRNGSWYVSSNAPVSFGNSTDKPAPADYDGDGKADFVVFRPTEGNWYLLQTTSGFGVIGFGTNGDIPTSKPVGSN